MIGWLATSEAQMKLVVPDLRKRRKFRAEASFSFKDSDVAQLATRVEEADLKERMKSIRTRYYKRKLDWAKITADNTRPHAATPSLKSGVGVPIAAPWQKKQKRTYDERGS
jgi:hypothetical protein